MRTSVILIVALLTLGSDNVRHSAQFLDDAREQAIDHLCVTEEQARLHACRGVATNHRFRLGHMNSR